MCLCVRRDADAATIPRRYYEYEYAPRCRRWIYYTTVCNMPVALPGGGRLSVRYAGSEGHLVVDQIRTNGQRFRWLLSASGLICETVVEVVAQPIIAHRIGTRRACATPQEVFLHSELLPAYNRAMAAALGLTACWSRHFLFLGFGGGALTSFLAAHHPRCIMTGVDASAETLALAVQYFGCTQRGPRTQLHCCTAEEFLRRHRAFFCPLNPCSLARLISCTLLPSLAAQLAGVTTRSFLTSPRPCPHQRLCQRRRLG
jgi:hypothetical protein